MNLSGVRSVQFFSDTKKRPQNTSRCLRRVPNDFMVKHMAEIAWFVCERTTVCTTEFNSTIVIGLPFLWNLVKGQCTQASHKLNPAAASEHAC